VITDQAMPGLTGLQLADAIRAKRPHMPIILATGYAELPSTTDPSIPKLSKPFNQDALAQAIVDCATRVEVSRRVVSFRPKKGG
jgi:FixJ family two-component response regulator